MTPTPYHLISGIDAIVTKYDAFLIDLWGVIHDGNTLYPYALEALEQLKARDKSVVLVSNSPRRAWQMIELLEKLGVKRDVYRDIMTSGELLCSDLENNKIVYGKNYYFFGPEDRYVNFKDITSYKRVTVLEEADFIIAIHFSSEYPTLESSRPFLEKAEALNIPMICANPDKISMLQDGTKMVCIGSMASLYEAMKGEVLYYGKPYKAIYEAAIKLLPSTISHQKLLAIGDGIETDIEGASNMKIDSCLVARGIPSLHLSFDSITNVPTPDSLSSFLTPYMFRPSYIVPFFAWGNN